MSGFQKGDRVKCIPGHANGDPNHPDCETGVVKRIHPRRAAAFVIYDNAMCVMKTGDEPYTAQCTNLSDLVPH